MSLEDDVYAPPTDVALLAARRHREDLRRVLELPAGRQVLWEYVERSRLFTPTLYGGAELDMAYRLGKRDFGAQMYEEMCQAAPEIINQLLTERNQKNGTDR